MAVITTFLALIGIYIPFFKLIVNWVWTIPIVLVTVRHGLLAGTLSIGVAGLLILSFAGPVEAVLLMVEFGGLALLYGYAFHKNLNPGIALLGGTLVAILSTLVLYGLYFLIAGINLFDLAGQMRESIQPTIDLYRSMGIFDKYAGQGLTEETVRQMLNSAVYFLSLVVPGFLVIMGLSSAFLNYIIAQKILARLFRTQTPQLPLFRLWRLPWWTVWGFIAGFAAYLLGSYTNQKLLSVAGMNVMLVYWLVAFVLGLAVISFFMHKKPEKLGLYRFILIITLVFFFQYATLIIGGFGIADLLFNYRRLPG